MNLWSTRIETQNWLNGRFKKESDFVAEGFLLMDECIECFSRQKASLPEFDGLFAKICGQTTVKARNYILGCYSLTIDALSQESGALLRPYLETYELLMYFRLEPKRVIEARDQKLPSAGKIAQKIDGQFHELRKFLSDNSSHFGFTDDSLRHLIDYSSGNLKAVATHSPERFHYNLSCVFIFLNFALVESLNCLSLVCSDHVSLIDNYEKWKQEGMSLFGLTQK